MNAPQSSMQAHVLVIDDEPQLRKLLEVSLRASAYRVSLAASARSGIDALATSGADLVVLDLGLPDMDGQEVIRDIREWSDVPILVLSVRSDESGKVAAFDAGANDYVTKPFGTPELLARIRALLRDRMTSGDTVAAVYDDGRLRVDIAKREVMFDGQPLRLSRKEYALLSVLVRHAGLVVTQPQLLRELWGPTHDQDTHYLRILVAKLRQKLGDDATAPRWIYTEPGVGLRLVPASDHA